MEMRVEVLPAPVGAFSKWIDFDASSPWRTLSRKTRIVDRTPVATASPSRSRRAWSVVSARSADLIGSRSVRWKTLSGVRLMAGRRMAFPGDVSCASMVGCATRPASSTRWRLGVQRPDSISRRMRRIFSVSRLFSVASVHCPLKATYWHASSYAAWTTSSSGTPIFAAAHARARAKNVCLATVGDLAVLVDDDALSLARPGRHRQFAVLQGADDFEGSRMHRGSRRPVAEADALAFQGLEESPDPAPVRQRHRLGRLVRRLQAVPLEEPTRPMVEPVDRQRLARPEDLDRVGGRLAVAVVNAE